MNKIEEYALKIVADGAESRVEDDGDEEGVFDETFVEDGPNPEHDKAIQLAMAIVRGMRANPAAVLALAEVQP